MSNLDHPISVLIREGGRISNSLPQSAKEITKFVKKLNGINRALSILEDEKRKDNEQKREPFSYVKR